MRHISFVSQRGDRAFDAALDARVLDGDDIGAVVVRDYIGALRDFHMAFGLINCDGTRNEDFWFDLRKGMLE